ncbi:MAG: mannitol dehydrogenase family protein [Pseudomonadota bacterium]
MTLTGSLQAAVSLPLSDKTLGSLPSNIAVPRYDRSQVTTGVAHIGPSHFFRAHIARYFDDILAQDPSWGITTINVRPKKEPDPEASPDKALRDRTPADVLREQDYLYTTVEQSVHGIQRRVIGSVGDMISAPENPRKALSALVDPNVKLVTLTLTEKGYGHDPATGTLNVHRPDIIACLESMDGPSTAVGYIVAAIEGRKEKGFPPLTIMSCDNMAGNGNILRNAVCAYAGEKSKDLRQYIEDNIAFPNTMVDRIVPGVTTGDLFDSKAAGVDDQWPVVCEGYSEWVVEDKFSGERPPLEQVGVTITPDVYAHELKKIRMLNGAHVAVGMIGRLAGYEYVDEAIADPRIARFVDAFMQETSDTLRPLDGVDYSLYSQGLVERLQNPYIKDELTRLPRNATTGKLNTRILDPIRDAIAQERDWRCHAFTTAAWIQYLKGVDQNGEHFDIVDRNAVETGLQETAKKSNGNPGPIISASGIFGNDLGGNPTFVAEVQRHLHNIQRHGITHAIDMIEPQRPSRDLQRKKYPN